MTKCWLFRLDHWSFQLDELRISMHIFIIYCISSFNFSYDSLEGFLKWKSLASHLTCSGKIKVGAREWSEGWASGTVKQHRGVLWSCTAPLDIVPSWARSDPPASCWDRTAVGGAEDLCLLTDLVLTVFFFFLSSSRAWRLWVQCSNCGQIKGKSDCSWPSISHSEISVKAALRNLNIYSNMGLHSQAWLLVSFRFSTRFLTAAYIWHFEWGARRTGAST